MIAAIIVAAGRGDRMQTATPKQYLELQGKPLLAHSLVSFAAVSAVDRLVVVLPPGDEDRFRNVVLPHLGGIVSPKLVAGGACRQDSVFNGLAALPDDVSGDDLVLIHDGARPLVTPALIVRCIQEARRQGACLPVLEPAETVKEVDSAGNVVRTVDRQRLGLAQTPQAFGLKLIRQAHKRARQAGIRATDDACLLEIMGIKVATVTGEPENVKITYPVDLALAELIVKSRSNAAK